VDNLDFLYPIRVGDLVILRAHRRYFEKA